MVGAEHSRGHGSLTCQGFHVFNALRTLLKRVWVGSFVVPLSDSEGVWFDRGGPGGSSGRAGEGERTGPEPRTACSALLPLAS